MTVQSTDEIKKKEKIDWTNSIFLSLSPVAAIVATGFYVSEGAWRLADLILFLTMSGATGLSITAGYHRLFTHRTYKCHWGVELFYLLFGAAALQNSALEWCADHRFHHQHVDSERDPYSIKKGFLHAHILWIFKQQIPGHDFKSVPDLVRNRLVMWQYRHYMKIGIVVGFLLPTLIGWLYGSAMGGFLFGGLLRVVILHHGTFLINSAAHVFGTQPYSKENSARDSAFLAFFTYGEGYHNFHHAFQGDYRNGVRRYHWDPTKWWIFSLYTLGLAFNLRRSPGWAVSRAQHRIHENRAQLILDSMEPKLANQMHPRVTEAASSVQEALNRWRETRQRYQSWLKNQRSLAHSERRRIEKAWKEKMDQCKSKTKHAAREFKKMICLLEETTIVAA